MRAVAFVIDPETAIAAVPPRRRDFWRVLLGRFQPDVETVEIERSHFFTGPAQQVDRV